MTPEIKAAFELIPEPQRDVVLGMRDLVFDCAGSMGVEVEEVLRWGQPSYIAPKGSTLRLGVSKSGQPAIFAHCQSRTVSTFADQFGQDFQIEGNRAVYVDALTPDARSKLCHLISHGLQYKLRK